MSNELLVTVRIVLVFVNIGIILTLLVLVSSLKQSNKNLLNSLNGMIKIIKHYEDLTQSHRDDLK